MSYLKSSPIPRTRRSTLRMHVEFFIDALDKSLHRSSYRRDLPHRRFHKVQYTRDNNNLPQILFDAMWLLYDLRKHHNTMVDKRHYGSYIMLIFIFINLWRVRTHRLRTSPAGSSSGMIHRIVGIINWESLPRK